jgi:hypothetical protein
MSDLSADKHHPDDDIPVMSTGQPSTLKSYRQLAAAFFGADGAAVRFIDEHIAADPDGEDGVVIADEGQMIYLFVQLTKGEKR